MEVENELEEYIIDDSSDEDDVVFVKEEPRIIFLKEENYLDNIVISDDEDNIAEVADLPSILCSLSTEVNAGISEEPNESILVDNDVSSRIYSSIPSTCSAAETVIDLTVDQCVDEPFVGGLSNLDTEFSLLINRINEEGESSVQRDTNVSFNSDVNTYNATDIVDLTLGSSFRKFFCGSANASDEICLNSSISRTAESKADRQFSIFSNNRDSLLTLEPCNQHKSFTTNPLSKPLKLSLKEYPEPLCPVTVNSTLCPQIVDFLSHLSHRAEIVWFGTINYLKIPLVIDGCLYYEEDKRKLINALFKYENTLPAYVHEDTDFLSIYEHFSDRGKNITFIRKSESTVNKNVPISGFTYIPLGSEQCIVFRNSRYGSCPGKYYEELFITFALGAAALAAASELITLKPNIALPDGPSSSGIVNFAVKSEASVSNNWSSYDLQQPHSSKQDVYGNRFSISSSPSTSHYFKCLNNGSSYKSNTNAVNCDNNISCSVCLDSKDEIVERGVNLCSTVCGHVFCEPCITQVVKEKKQCPKCRKRLTKKQFHPLFI